MIVEWLNNQSDLIIASSTVTLCAVTFFYARYTKKILDQHTIPRVLVGVLPDSTYPQLMNFQIKNVGLGIATEIHFELKGNFPPLHFNDNEGTRHDFGPLTTGIRILAPGEEVTFFWQEFIKLNDQLGTETPEVICRYNSMTNDKFQHAFPISIRHRALGSVRIPPLQKIADNLEKILKVLKGRS